MECLLLPPAAVAVGGQEHARHVAFRMVNHSVCQKLILLHAELTEDRTKADADTAVVGGCSLPKELALFVMDHELFSERYADMSQSAASMPC